MGSDSAVTVFLTNWATLSKLLKIVQHFTGSPVVQSREVQCKSPQSIVMKLYKKELGRTGDAEPMAAGWSWQNGGSHRTQANRLQIAWNICPSPQKASCLGCEIPQSPGEFGYKHPVCHETPRRSHVVLSWPPGETDYSSAADVPKQLRELNKRVQGKTCQELLPSLEERRPGSCL